MLSLQDPKLGVSATQVTDVLLLPEDRVVVPSFHVSFDPSGKAGEIEVEGVLTEELLEWASAAANRRA
jgi:hypothetical protein